VQQRERERVEDQQGQIARPQIYHSPLYPAVMMVWERGHRRKLWQIARRG
jgi:hypothetical protein